MSVPTNAVAVVDGTPITKAELDALLDAGQEVVHAQKRAFPKAGTRRVPVAADAGRRVPRAARRVRQGGGRSSSIAVTDKEVDRLAISAGQEAVLRRQPEEARRAAEGAGLHDRSVPRRHRGAAALGEALRRGDEGRQGHRRRGRGVLRRRTRASTRSPRRRDVRHILVQARRRSGRQDLRRRSRRGGDFAALAKKYSLDPGSKDKGGKLTITRGQTVPTFDTAAFVLKTNADLQAGQDRSSAIT